MRFTMAESNTQSSNQPDSPHESEPFSIEVAVNYSIQLELSEVVRIVRRILEDHRFESAEISIAVVDDATISDLNRQYLGHDYETDVLSFVLECDRRKKTLHGEVIVSAETAIRAAAEQSVSVEAEIMLYVIHGTLHLVGLDDKIQADQIEMRNAEKHYTKLLGIAYAMPEEPRSGDGAD